MKIKIFNQEKIESDKIIRLKIVKERGNIQLQAVDENGERVCGGSLLEIRDDGKIKLFTAVSENIGFELDSLGRIEVI